MINLISKITNVSKDYYLLQENLIIRSTTDGTIRIIDHCGNVKRTLKKSNAILVFGDLLFINQNEFYDLSINRFIQLELKFVNNEIVQPLFSSSSYLLYKTVNEPQEFVTYFLYEIRTFTNVTLSIKSPLCLNDDGIHFLMDGYVSYMNTEGSVLWKVELKSSINGKSSRIYDQLILPMLDKSVVVLNARYGEVNWSLENVDGFGFNWFHYNSTIYRLIGNTYEEINLKTGERVVTADLKIFNMKNKIFFKISDMNCFDGKRIYFCSEISPKIGAFNCITKEVDWLYEFEENSSSYFIEPPQYRDGKLYVLDNEKVLHVFDTLN